MMYEPSNIIMILEILQKNGGFFFYNPINKRGVVGCKSELPEELGVTTLNESEISFFAIPFFSDINKKGEGLWNTMKMGEITFPYCYSILFSVGTQKKTTPTYVNVVDDYEKWCDLFDIIMSNIKAREVEKVVASRQVEILFDKDINLASCVLNLLKNNPQSYVFAYIYGGKAFIGATPEILVEKCGSRIQSYAVAGTFPKCENNEKRGKELLNDIKNNHEHKIVIEEIVSTMRTVTNKVSIGMTELMELKNLFHLKTSIVATDGQKNLIEWVRLLHPTPAMGGKPRKKALKLIEEYEQHDRGLFAAPIGIVEKNGDGIFVVGIRSALIDGNKIYAYAGCGIVEQSDCREEYEETNTKLRTILEAL